MHFSLSPNLDEHSIRLPLWAWSDRLAPVGMQWLSPPPLSLALPLRLYLVLILDIYTSAPASPSSSSLPLTLIGSFMAQLNRKTQILCFVTETIMTSVQAVHNSWDPYPTAPSNPAVRVEVNPQRLRWLSPAGIYVFTHNILRQFTVWFWS